ncbi:peptide/nickel transport system permease protein [Microbacterium resistens]|uniref:Peptide/nickel transport system permease protein n=1 Tax=Microbacterium resistens TaxID=156977 RepID=A0ABU1SFI1_9MICO|nr:ABC transporter permease [Microbacterium resistens]MDR6868364.1 peptide/nickel transport system permease protein [Microbacterium resistens]
MTITETQSMAAQRADGARRRRSPLRRALGSAGRNVGLVLASAYVLLVIAWVTLPGLFTSHSPIEGVVAERLRPPSLDHLFGTDGLGRDLFSRVVYGAANSVSAVLIAVAIAAVVGSAIGLLAGFSGRRVEDALMRVVDTLLAIPALLLSMTIIVVLGYGLVNIAVAVGVASIASFARLMRSDVVRVRNELYVEAARAAGVRWGAVLLRHVLPNAIGPVLALVALEFGIAILAVSALSFLGYGAPPPSPEWGRLVADGRDFIATSWWIATLPGLAITLLVLSTNRISKFITEAHR